MKSWCLEPGGLETRLSQSRLKDQLDSFEVGLMAIKPAFQGGRRHPAPGHH